MSAVCLSIDGRLYILGLSWRFHAKRPRRAELIRRAQTLGPWAVLHHGRLGVWQSGYCQAPTDAPAAHDCLALAAMLVDGLHEHFLGIVDLGDGRYWMLAVGEDLLIHPDGDVVGSLEQIEAACASMQQHGSWKIEVLDLETIRQRLRSVPVSGARLHDYSGSRALPWLILMIAGLLALVLIVLAGVHWHRQRLAAQQLALQQAALHRTAVKPGAGLPDPQALFAVCAKSWSQQELAHAGWMLEDWSCQVEHGRLLLKSSWTDAGGSAADAPGQLSADAHSAQSQLDGAVVHTASSTVAIDEPSAMRQLWSLPPMYAVSLSGDHAHGIALRLDSTAPPWVSPWAQSLQAVAGLRLVSVHWNSRSGWSCAGRLFSRSSKT